MTIVRTHFKTPVFIFDIQDRFARDRSIYGLTPSPLTNLKFEIVGQRINNNMQLWKSHLHLKLVQNCSGYLIWFGKLESYDGVILHDALLPGHYALRISCPSHVYQPYETDDFVIPEDTENMGARILHYDLEPGHAYPYPKTSTLPGGKGTTQLRGSLRFADGRPIAKAIVECSVIGVKPFKTDDSGEWVLVFPDEQPSGRVTVTVKSLNNGDPMDMTVSDVSIEQGCVNSLRQTTLRGRVVDGEKVGVDGANITIEGLHLHSKTDTDGSWICYFPLEQTEPISVSVTATHPDGRDITKLNIIVTPQLTSEVPIIIFN